MTNIQEKKFTPTKWKPTDKRFVAFFDLLGFKDKVMRKSHEEIYDELSKISRIKDIVENKNGLKSKEKYKDCDVYVVSFSDSIVIFSKNDSFENFEYFLIAIRAIFSNSLREKIALKGGFAHGQVSLNKAEQIYFGQPIIDAYLIEEDVNYLGVVAHSSIDQFLKSQSEKCEKSIICNKLLFEEKTYLKCGKITHLNLDWFILTQKDHDKLKPAEKIKNILKDLDAFNCTVSGSPRRYIDNTKELLQLAFKEKKINLEIIKINEL